MRRLPHPESWRSSGYLTDNQKVKSCLPPRHAPHWWVVRTSWQTLLCSIFPVGSAILAYHFITDSDPVVAASIGTLMVLLFVVWFVIFVCVLVYLVNGIYRWVKKTDILFTAEN